MIVDFWSPTCTPCKAIETSLENLAERFSDRVKILTVNANESPQLVRNYMIRGLPTLIFLKDSQVKGQLVGAVSYAEIEKKLLEIT